jgi:hypothetical protein
MMTQPTATAADPAADPALVTLEFQHQHRLLDRAGDGLQIWSVRIDAAGETIGTMRATRCLYWNSGNLYERMTDEGHFLAHVAPQFFTPDGSFTTDYEEAVEIPGNLLVIDHLDLPSPWQNPIIAAALVAAAIDRLTDNTYAVVLPDDTADTADTVPGAALLHQAAALLAAEECGDDLHLIDTSLAAPEKAAHHVRRRLAGLSHHGPQDLDDEEFDDEYDEDDTWELTPRTAAVLRLALEDLSQRAWEEVAALGDEALVTGAAGLFASLPRVTFHQSGQWRRQMARTFDDLTQDIAAGRHVDPACTGEEMALHLAISRAEELVRDRPSRVANAIEGLPVHRHDLDLEACSDLLFQDHDVLMLFDEQLARQPGQPGARHGEPRSAGLVHALRPRRSAGPRAGVPAAVAGGPAEPPSLGEGHRVHSVGLSPLLTQGAELHDKVTARQALE